MGKYKGLIVVGSIILILLLLVALPLMSYSNAEVDLRTSVQASQKDNQVVYDRVWKTIQQQAGVTSEYSEQFRAIYRDIMNGRNPEGQGKLVKFVKEANPNFDSSLFTKLMTSIEGQRKDYERKAEELIDRSREHNKLLQTMPGSFYLSFLGRKPIDIQLVTSTRTDDAFKSGKDDDTNLFGGKK
jgi:hypothetical protein